MKRKDIVKAFNPDIDDKSLQLIDELSMSEINAINSRKMLHELENYIIDNMSIIKNRIEDVNIKINTALFGNKKFINESYAFEVPLNENYFLDPKRVQFKENILTTKMSQDGTQNKHDLNIMNITSKRKTDFKLLGNTLYIEKNTEHSYQELEIHIPKHVLSGYLYIKFNKYDNISVLDKFGREITDKSITNEIHQVISKDTQSIILRFHNNKDKSFVLESFYVTEENFSLVSEVETKPIRIGHHLSQIGINTCDNYSDENINISYKISINGGAYKEIRPLNKQKNLELKSILSVDTEEHYYELSDYSLVHDEMLFHVDSITLPDINIIRAFNYKLGVDEGLVRGRTIYFRSLGESTLTLHKGDELELNGTKIVAPEDNFKITLNPGFNTIVAKSHLLRESENLLFKTDIKISEDYKTMSYTNTLDNKQYNKLIDFNPNKKNQNSLIYQLITQGEIYLEPVSASKKYVNNTLYITKESRLKNLHIFVKSKVLRVDTVQLKIKLESSNKNNPAYISSLFIRGTQ